MALFVRSSHEGFILTHERKTEVGKSLDCTEVELLLPSNQFYIQSTAFLHGDDGAHLNARRLL